MRRKEPKRKAENEGTVAYNELNQGSYFTWREELYRKIPGGNALHIESDRIMAFGFGNRCIEVPKPQRRIDLVIQYLHWALIQAHAEADPKAEEVTVVICPKLKQCTTSVKP